MQNRIILVAGYDASPETKAIADYICNGDETDPVLVKAAIDHCPEGATIQFVGDFKLLPKESK